MLVGFVPFGHLSFKGPGLSRVIPRALSHRILLLSTALGEDAAVPGENDVEDVVAAIVAWNKECEGTEVQAINRSDRAR